MNYYNPYFFPYASVQTTAPSLFSRLLGGNKLTLSSILSGTGKVINFANQAIPLVKQAGPVIQNAKTMFRVMNEFKKVDTNQVENNEVKEKEVITSTSNNMGPTFFL